MTVNATFDKPFIALSQAMVEVQGALEPVRKDGKNPQFKSRYATLDNVVEAIQPALSANGLCAIFFPKFQDELAGVALQIRHKDGATLDCGELMLPLGRSQGAQGVGSSLTYARRYMLCSVFNLALDDDDDGNAAQKAKPASKPKPETKPAAKPEPAPVDTRTAEDVMPMEQQATIQRALKALADAKGLDAVHLVLNAHNATKVADLRKAQFADVLNAAEEASK